MAIEVLDGGDEWVQISPRLQGNLTSVIPCRSEVESYAQLGVDFQLVKDQFAQLVMSEVVGFILVLFQVNFKNCTVHFFISDNFLETSQLPMARRVPTFSPC